MSDEEDEVPLDDLAERLGLNEDESDEAAENGDTERPDDDGEASSGVPVDPPDEDGEEGEADSSVVADAADESEGDTLPEDAPLGDIARRVRERRDRKASGGRGEAEDVEDIDELSELDEVDEDSLFESMSVGEVDSESVWEELVETDDATQRYPGVGGPAERVGVNDEYVVEKATFCKRCPFLNDPPKLGCDNEGTEILEVVDSEHFRVRGCPMVEESEATIGEF